MRKNKYFSLPSSQFDFVANEKKLLDWWYKKEVVKKYLNKNKNAKKNFSFIDGPITANNPMGVHHAWGRTLKDLYQRYKNMQGFCQRFQNGFDCQGLWVEVEVEKEKGFKNKKDIENYGIDKFVQDCKERVFKYAAVQTQQSIRLGYFMDWENSYYTLSDENNYMIWHFLKVCHQEGNIYKGTDSVPWCPRCGTAVTQHEILDGGYHQRTHEAVYMRFPLIKDGKLQQDEYLLVWTTTPWTIPADTLVAVHPKLRYAQVEYQGKKYWLAHNLINKIFNQPLAPLKVITGRQLIREEKITHYKAAFDNLPIIKQIAKSPHFHQVVEAKDLVTEEEGTGLVHIVPGAGTEDHHLVKNQLRWPEVIFPVVDEDGSYLEGYGFLTGKNAKDHPEFVINYLKEKENGRYLFKLENYTHSYPLCWRCGTELIWRLVSEWYIAMDNPRKSDGKTLRQRMMAVAKKINWLPEFGLKRELDWLKNMTDWLISKKRYWGLALPIWQCDCGWFEVIGSKEELKQKAVEGWSEFAGHSPHRPWIDKIKIRCPKCGKLIERVKDVGTPWLDAGIVPFSTLVDPKTKKVSYLTDKKYWRQWYPADFITECFPGQFRNWFYSLIAMATALEDKEPFKTVLGHALVKDEKGEEMHKSKGNAIWFDEAAEKMGVDTLRWLYCRQDPEFNLNLGYKVANEVRRQYLLVLWNAYCFFLTYASLNNWQPIDQKLNLRNLVVLDQWILSRLESTKKLVSEKLDDYQHHLAISKIEKFLEDLSLWYIRRSRERLNPQNQNKKDQENCFQTLYYLLEQLALILAPFIPFLSEEIWQNLRYHQKNYDPNDSVHLQNWPKAEEKFINLRLEKTMAQIREIISQSHSQRQTAGIKVRQPLPQLTIRNLGFRIEKELIKLIKDELNLKKVKIIPGKGSLQVQLETKLTPKLIAEGKARELIRKVQVLRKQAGLSLQDKIKIKAPSWPKEFEKEILTKTGGLSIKKANQLTIVKI